MLRQGERVLVLPLGKICMWPEEGCHNWDEESEWIRYTRQNQWDWSVH